MAAAFTYGANETISAAAASEVTWRSGSAEVKRLWAEAEQCACEFQLGCKTAEGGNSAKDTLPAD